MSPHAVAMSARNGADGQDTTAARSATYFRVCAVATLVCAVGSGVFGVAALGRANEGRAFTGLGLVLVMLSIVMLALTVACVQIVSQLQARASRQRHRQ
jgi:Na+/melibiose symporter-like transporter